MQVSSVMMMHPATVGREVGLEVALQTMDGGGFRHLPVVEEGRLLGVVSERDLLEGLGRMPGGVPGSEDVLADSRPSSVGEVMTPEPHVLAPADGLHTAAGLMRSKAIGCLPVVAGEALSGLVTEMDLLAAFCRLWDEGQLDPAANPRVSDGMTTEVVSVSPETSLQDGCSTCFSNHIRHLPVVSEGKLVGMVSDRDLRGASTSAHPEALRMADLMASEVETADPGDSLVNAARRMHGGGISSLPVVEDGKLVGLVTLSDVMAHCAQALVVS